jgi:hypothetical protein
MIAVSRSHFVSKLDIGHLSAACMPVALSHSMISLRPFQSSRVYHMTYREVKAYSQIISHKIVQTMGACRAQSKKTYRQTLRLKPAQSAMLDAVQFKRSSLDILRMSATERTIKQSPATSIPVDTEMDEVLDALSQHLRLSRTQVVEQAILRMGRHEGLIVTLQPVGGGTRQDQARGSRSDSDRFSVAGQEAFSRIWDTPEEDAAWAHLQEQT